jgi:hypothetical protein
MYNPFHHVNVIYRLDRCHRITDAAFDSTQCIFEPLVGCLSLEAISLQGCPQLTGGVVRTLNKLCHKLKCLNLSQVCGIIFVYYLFVLLFYFSCFYYNSAKELKHLPFNEYLNIIKSFL